MPRADSHDAAARGAQVADDQLRSVERAKHAVAVDPQRDKFAETAARAKREGWQRTNGTRSNE